MTIFVNMNGNGVIIVYIFTFTRVVVVGNELEYGLMKVRVISFNPT